ncbi:MAG: hypothetical protein ACOCP4_04745 [Candidatus Woesearchaeota archaeon]
MKIRQGFVSNSSSCSFTITNTSNKKKSMIDFATETLYLLEEWEDCYDWNKSQSQEELKKKQKLFLKEASDIYYDEWKPGETKEVVFGDEDRTLMGRVYDYMLRDSDSSDSFQWNLKEMMR